MTSPSPQGISKIELHQEQELGMSLTATVLRYEATTKLTWRARRAAHSITIVRIKLTCEMFKANAPCKDMIHPLLCE